MCFLNSSAKKPYSLCKGMETSSDQWHARLQKYKPPPPTNAVHLGSIQEVLEDTGLGYDIGAFIHPYTISYRKKWYIYNVLGIIQEKWH